MEPRYQPGVRSSTLLGMLGECLLIVFNWGRSFQQDQIPDSWGTGQCQRGDKWNFSSLMLRVSPAEIKEGVVESPWHCWVK